MTMEYFEKVIGYADIKFELARIIDIMNHPAKYAKLGVAVPSGVMLYGMPGVGKTLLANEFIRASGRRSFLCRKDQPDGAFIKHLRKQRQWLHPSFFWMTWTSFPVRKSAEAMRKSM